MQIKNRRLPSLQLFSLLLLLAVVAGGTPSRPADTATRLLYTFDELLPVDEATRQLYGFDSRAAGLVRDASGREQSAAAIMLTHSNVVTGRFGRAVDFNGKDQYLVVDTTTGLEFTQENFTLEVWFKPAGDGTLCSLLSDATSTHGRYQLLLENGVPSLCYRATSGAPHYRRLGAVEPLLSNRWHYVAAVFDRTAGQVALHVDGQLVKSQPWNGQTWGTGGQAFYVGAHLAGKPTSFFAGEIDELRITATALTSEAIREAWLAPLRASQAASAWAAGDLLGFVVPPITATRWLPNVLPPEGQITNVLHVTGARGSYEPASFILYPFATVDKLHLGWTELTSDSGKHKIPAESLTIRLVKRWYQSGNAWDHYPLQDGTRRRLIPELLLNDQELIRVDHEKQENYLRLDTPQGSSYDWISYPEADKERKLFFVPHIGRLEFNYAVEPVNDAARLQPVALTAGEAQQFWVTIELPESAAAGRYRGSINLTANGRPLGAFQLEVEVLPFTLPPPATYYDTEKPYHTIASHHARLIVWRALLAQAGITGNVDERITQRLQAEFENMRRHNISHPNGPIFPQPDAETFLAELRMRQVAGFTLDPLFGGTPAAIDGWWQVKNNPDSYPDKLEAFKERIKLTFKLVESVMGHRNIIFEAIDEGQKEQLEIQRDGWHYIHEQGGRVGATGWGLNIRLAGDSQDYHCWAGKPTRERSALWHTAGGIVGSYAYPFSGPENPLLWRRNQGLVHYKANYDAALLYAYYEGTPNIWNDFIKSNRYRNFCIVYPTRDGVIDTLAWEAFREGIDDIRYATLLKRLAQEALRAETSDTVRLGKRALVWLELLDAETADLDAARRAMIDWILQLRTGLGANK